MHKLAARVYLMVYDHGLTLEEAISWVIRRMPRSLRKYYRNAIVYTIVKEVIL